MHVYVCVSVCKNYIEFSQHIYPGGENFGLLRMIKYKKKTCLNLALPSEELRPSPNNFFSTFSSGILVLYTATDPLFIWHLSSFFSFQWWIDKSQPSLSKPHHTPKKQYTRDKWSSEKIYEGAYDPGRCYPKPVRWGTQAISVEKSRKSIKHRIELEVYTLAGESEESLILPWTETKNPFTISLTYW